MPAFKPGGTLEISLDDDSDLRFVVSAISVSQALDLADKLDSVSGTDREVVSQLEEIISPLIHGWVNGPCEYSWQALLDNLGPADLWRLPWKVKQQVGYREKKD
jgi:hypothetical protein